MVLFAPSKPFWFCPCRRCFALRKKQIVPESLGASTGHELTAREIPRTTRFTRENRGFSRLKIFRRSRLKLSFEPGTTSLEHQNETPKANLCHARSSFSLVDHLTLFRRPRSVVVLLARLCRLNRKPDVAPRFERGIVGNLSNTSLT